MFAQFITRVILFSMVESCRLLCHSKSMVAMRLVCFFSGSIGLTSHLSFEVDHVPMDNTDGMH